MFSRKPATVLSLLACQFALVACGHPVEVDPRTEARVVRTAVVQEGKPASRSFTGVSVAAMQASIVKQTLSTLEQSNDVQIADLRSIRAPGGLITFATLYDGSQPEGSANR